MFTGIVTATGRVQTASRRDSLLRLTVAARPIATELKRGDSVAVDGVCLTAVDVGRKRFRVEAVAETLARTTLGDLARGDVVNLELAMRPSDRFGGHLVQGHVDGRVRVAAVEPEGSSRRVRLEAPGELLGYVVPKGSVALNGVSLTVGQVTADGFDVVIIPHTLDATSFGSLKADDELNCEIDLIAKYVERLSAPLRAIGEPPT